MNKKYLFSMVAATLIFTSNIKSETINNIVTPPTIDNNSTSIMYAPSEAIITFKEGSNLDTMIQYMNGLFGNSYSHTEYKLINGMHIVVPNSNFEQIENILLNSAILKDSIDTIEKNFAIRPFDATNDSYYSKLWAIENIAQEVNGVSGTNDADMDIKEAWDIQKGDSSVVIAILDTGVDYTHSDLVDNMWSGNSKHGYDFAGDDDGNNDDDPMPDTPYDDNGHYHGTHVAGIIGAVGNNSNGVSGVAQNVQIMAIKIFRPNGYGYSSDMLEGLDYIAEQKDNGVNIVAINASYGGIGGSDGDSIDKAIENLGQKGIIFCVAAGNDGKDIDSDPVYPASYKDSNIISVAATNQDDNITSFSNYGLNSVDVAAPGENILSTYPDDSYAYMQGTSMATPYVTGIVALLFSQKNDATVDEIIKAITKSVEVKDNLNGKVATSGRVNAYKALKYISNNAPIANDDSVQTPYETKVIIDVLSNDSDIDGDSLNIVSITSPSNGKAVIVDGKIEYTPNSGFSGVDSFSYTIDDGNGKNSVAEVNITVEEKPNSAPIASDDNISVDEDNSILIDVLSNDSDEDGDNLTITNVTTPNSGSAVIKDGRIEYTPNSNFNGSDRFSYTISDSNGAESNATVNIDVISINDEPIAKDDNITLNEDSSILIDILGNDSDIDGDSLSIKILSNPKNGAISLENGKVKYTPKDNFYGVDTFSYVVNDGTVDSNEANVTINVLDVNDAPIAKGDLAVVNEDNSTLIDVLSNDSDIEGDTLAINSVDVPKNGSAIIEDGKIRYTPNSNFNGNDTFLYEVVDARGAKSYGEVNVTVVAVNDAPIANDDSVQTPYETKVIIDVLSNDSDIDGDSLSIKSLTLPKNGSVSIENGKIEYTPNSGFSGEDNFSYIIDDGNVESNSAVVTINVKEQNDNAPVANNDNVVIDEDSSILIDVLDNDSDEDKDSLKIVNITTPNNGVAVIKDGKIEYTPDSNFYGDDSFEYEIENNNTLKSKATVNIKVNPINDIPIAKDDNISIDEDSSILIDVLNNDFDEDNDTLEIKSITQPSNGIATIENNRIKYTPKDNFNGVDSFNYTISDGIAEISAKVNIKIDSINDEPIAKDDEFVTKEDRAIILDVLSNDSDIDGDSLSIKSVEYANNGRVKIDNNKIEYIPNSNFNGEDSFSYSVVDSSGAQSRANVKILVEPINDAPIANKDIVTLNEDSSILIDVLSNDSDIDGDSLSIKIFSYPKNGTIEIVNNKIKYIPNADFSGVDSFSYMANDGKENSNISEVTINIKPINDAPIAVDDKYEIDEDTPILLDVIANDIDVDGDLLTIKGVTDAKNGIVEIVDNKIKYTPNSDFNGIDSFEYTIGDKNNITAKGSVNIKIDAINDAPSLKDDSVETDYKTKVIIDVLSNDIDVDGDKLFIKDINKPSNGVATIKDGKIEYIPNDGFSGVDSFSYSASDGKAVSSAKISVNVKRDIDSYPPIKIDPIEKIIKIFSGMSALNQNAENRYLLDNGDGYIEIYADKKEIKLEHKKTPFPKEPIGNIKNFDYKNGDIKLTFELKNDIKF